MFGVSNRLRNAAPARRDGARASCATSALYVEGGRLRPLIDRAFAFDELPAAIAFMESDAQVGKIVGSV